MSEPIKSNDEQLQVGGENVTAYKAYPKSSVLFGLKIEDFSDAGNAKAFVHEYKEDGEDLIYTDSRGWLYWTGLKWECNDHKALELAEEFSEQMLKEAKEENRKARHAVADLEADAAEGSKDETDLEEAKKRLKGADSYLKHAMMSRRSARIHAILDLARPFMVRSGETLDANPLELNTPGGIINLVTGEWRMNDPKAFCSKITAAGRSKKGAEIWERFLDQITCEDSSLKEFLQLVIGMALFGRVYQEGIVFAVGDGRNGKSTFFNAVAAVLGDYAGYIDIDVITTKNGNDKAALATLRGKRLVIAGELEEGRRLSAATVKKISSTDPFQVEEKYKAPDTVKPSHTLCLFTNHLPRVGSTDAGTWRRINVVPFKAKIQGSGTIQNYAAYLVENAGGSILSWAIEGAQNFARNGFHLTMPECVEEVTEAYRSREDWLVNFLEERCEREQGVRIGARELYSEYKSWCEANCEYTRRENEFSNEMGRIGFQKVTRGGMRFYLGVRVKLKVAVHEEAEFL